MYSKDQKVSSGTTNAGGEILFSKLLPGKYYVKETKTAAGYKLNTVIKNLTVTGGKTTTVNVTDIMDISGTVSIRKKMEIPVIHWQELNLPCISGVKKAKAM